MSFQATTLSHLQQRTDYEAWLLEEVYRITNQPIAVEDADELIYPPTGAPPTQTIFGVGSINIGDWCPGFLEAGAPLVLVTAFKLLDMILEWVLDQNGYQSTFRFAQKLKALRGSVQFPPLIGSRPWLQTRIVSLYASLIPLRGTIIHDRHFQAMSGNLLIATSKVGSALPPVPISATDLRTLAAIAVSLVRYLEGTWTLDLYGELLLRYRLDQLAYLHTRKPPWANKSPDSSTFESIPRLVPFSRST